MTEICCPHCMSGSYTTISATDGDDTVNLHVCLDCGTVYIPRDIINARFSRQTRIYLRQQLQQKRNTDIIAALKAKKWGYNYGS